MLESLLGYNRMGILIATHVDEDAVYSVGVYANVEALKQNLRRHTGKTAQTLATDAPFLAGVSCLWVQPEFDGLLDATSTALCQTYGDVGRAPFGLVAAAALHFGGAVRSEAGRQLVTFAATVSWQHGRCCTGLHTTMASGAPADTCVARVACCQTRPLHLRLSVLIVLTLLLCCVHFILAFVA
jgi:hypothetical protein